MAIMTGEQYLESMRKLKLNIYMFGEKNRKLREQSDPKTVPQFRKGHL